MDYFFAFKTGLY